MKRKVFAGIGVLALIFGLIGCPTDDDGKDKDGGDEYARYYEGTYRDNKNGTVNVVNNTPHDMLLFTGEVLNTNNIVGGVKAGDTAPVNFSQRADFTVGGYAVLKAVQQSVFDKNRNNSRVDNSAFVTYRNDVTFTVTIVSTTDGDYQYRVFNRSDKYAMELRKNTSIGEKVAFLAPGEQWVVIKTPSNDMMTLFPVWVAFNNVTKSIATFTNKDDPLLPQPVQPMPEKDRPDYNFPDSTTTVVFADVDLPFATIQIRNNQSRTFVFRIAGGPQPSQGGIQGINSGQRPSYDIESDGEGLNLNLWEPALNIQVPVRFEESPATLPVLKNGFIYRVSLELKDGQPVGQAGSYTAWLEEGGEINTNDFLIAY